MCKSGKVTYETRKAARAARSVLELNYNKKFCIYRCGACSLFHLATRYEKTRERGIVQRNVINYQRFDSLSDKIDRLVTDERRRITRASKAIKGNRRLRAQNRDKWHE